ncbi:MAG: hypothetical protein MI923_18260 [Phycisphaerales bacterium]|nr:hypothetical protein [Phycisphaerales bacterium]
MEQQRFDPELSGDLLGYHLGLADRETCARVEAAFDTPEALQAACDRLQRRLAPLDTDAVELPQDLNRRILDRVEAETNTRTLPLSKAAAMSDPADAESATGNPSISLRELSGLAAAVLIFVGIFIPGYQHAKLEAQKAACVNNLRILGNGHIAYGEMNASQWPYAGNTPKDIPWDRSEARNSRHSYLMITEKFVPVSNYVCQGSEGDRILDVENPQDYSGFPDPRNCSYSMTFLTGPWNQQKLAPDEPIVSDMTPLVDENRKLILQGRVMLNSRSHGRPGGQSVLNADNSASHYNSPKVGLENDDIYRLIGVDEYNGLERPRLRSDAFLIP